MHIAHSATSPAPAHRPLRPTGTRAVPCLTLLTLLCAALPPTQAQTIFSKTGPNESAYALFTYPNDDSNQNQILAASWSETTGFSNAYIGARLSDFGLHETGTAFLTTQLGPATSAASLVATSHFAFPDSEANFPLFSGLSLLPNTIYYLTISADVIPNEAAQALWYGTSMPTVQTAPGVTDNGSYVTEGGSAFPPSDAFISNPGLGLEYTVSVGPPIPETSTMVSLGMLLTMGLGGLIVARPRRKVGLRPEKFS